ncbi:hypothetical protein [Actinocorallia longicatena]|uniref:Uncharacterized protein n=1 Tax=Actinocorallia longicatena TaxID=111803 RepID=A0ABP6Q3F3_9ACTN
MSTHRALTMLWEDWAEVRSALPEGRGEELDDLVEQLADEGDPVVVRALAVRVARLLLDLGDEHEIRAELRGGDRDEHGAGPDDEAWFGLAERLAVRADPARPTSEEIAAAPDLLPDAAMLDAADLAAAGLPPDPPGLIRLDPETGPSRWPAFQFGPDGLPRPVVQEINTLLGSDEDPFAVAEWWLGRNGWLGGVPADLLGAIPDDRLLAAARALGTEG